MADNNNCTDKRNKYLLVFNQPDDTDCRIRDENVFSIIKLLESISTNNEENEIHLMLNSRGGNIYAAYKLVNVLRSKCSCLVTIIPFRAKSAATLMALGSNYLVMAPFSELGPLDLPMEHPTLEGTGYYSALDALKSIEFLANSSLKLTKRYSKQVKSTWGLSRKDSVNAGMVFSSNFLTPIISKLDPWIISKCERELCIAELYCIEFLKKYMFKNDGEAEKIAYKLKINYPEHSFSISADHAKSLGLNIVHSVDFAYWDFIWTLFKQLPDNKETIRLYSYPDKNDTNKHMKKNVDKLKLNAKM